MIPGESRRVRYLNGQRYERIGWRMHECLNGRVVELTVYLSQCADCGDWFELCALKNRRFQPNRRCERHRQPGVRVAGNVKTRRAKKGSARRA